MNKILHGIAISVNHRTFMHRDNQVATYIAINSNFHAWIKHRGINCHYVRHRLHLLESAGNCLMQTYSGATKWLKMTCRAVSTTKLPLEESLKKEVPMCSATASATDLCQIDSFHLEILLILRIAIATWMTFLKWLLSLSFFHSPCSIINCIVPLNGLVNAHLSVARKNSY